MDKKKDILKTYIKANKENIFKSTNHKIGIFKNFKKIYENMPDYQAGFHELLEKQDKNFFYTCHLCDYYNLETAEKNIAKNSKLLKIMSIQKPESVKIAGYQAHVLSRINEISALILDLMENKEKVHSLIRDRANIDRKEKQKRANYMTAYRQKKKKEPKK